MLLQFIPIFPFFVSLAGIHRRLSTFDRFTNQFCDYLLCKYETTRTLERAHNLHTG
jgi:hypothetical protein